MSPRGYVRRRGVAVVGTHGSGVDDEVATVYVAKLPNGPLLVLQGTAAIIWLAAAPELARPAPVLEERLVARVAEDVGLAADVVRADVVAFLSELAAHGVLDATDVTPDPSVPPG